MIIPFIITLLSFSPSQNISDFSVDFNFDEIYLNDRNQLYFVTDNSIVIKTDLKGDTTYTYEEKSQKITALDVTNSMRTLAHSNVFNTIVFLDQTLTPIQDPFEVDRLDIPFVKAFGMSRDNNFWVFNEMDQTLVKIDQNARIKSVSQKMYLMFQKSIQPVQLLERNNQVYLLDPNVGMIQFDFLGTYKFLYKDIKGEKFEVINDKVIFLKEKNIYVFDMVLMEMKKVKLPFDEVDNFCVNNKKLVVSKGQNIYILTLNM